MRVASGLLLLFCLLAQAGSGSAAKLRYTDRDPVFSPDGKTIAFVRYGPTTQSIMLIDVDGKHLRTLVATSSPSGLAWSPDGASIAYSVGQSNIWRVAIATGSTTQLTHDGPLSDWQPSWSPDGKTIAYDKFERCFRCTGIWVMNADGSNQHEIFTDGRRPTFSPASANMLALSLTSASVIGLDGTPVVPGEGAYTVWSPHGSYIAYTSEGLWVENIQTKAPRRISRWITERPSWSPDGRVIAGGYHTKVALLHSKDGSHLIVIANSTVEAGTPSWAGASIAYAHAGYCGIDLAHEDGTHIRRLTRAC